MVEGGKAMNKQELKQLISATDYAGTTVSKEFKKGFREGMKISADMLEQLDEPQKPVVPKFVAEWIEYAKKKGDSLAISFKPWNLYGVEYSKADRWIEDNQETFARAWIDGYEVEESKWVVNEGDLVIRKGEHEAKVYFVESVDDDGILLVNGIKDEFFTDLDDRSVDEESINYFYENFRLLAKKENLEAEKVEV